MILTKHPITTILCAGPGLGFYVPGIIVNRRLTSGGFESDVAVFEEFLVESKKNNVHKTKRSFHSNFAFALMAQKLAQDPSPYLDEKAVELLLLKWKTEKRSHFLVFSGFWIPILNQYISSVTNCKLVIHLCHLDAANSTSWSLYDTSASPYHHIWFNNWENKEISFFIDITGDFPMSFEHRSNSFLIHGGGWGMGNYKEYISSLNNIDAKLDIIAYQQEDLLGINPLNTYHMIDPNWKTWDKKDSYHLFPPFGKVNGNDNIVFSSNFGSPDIYSIAREKKGIISKPGAGTLLDSISSATPLILLTPFGDYENKNALLWKHFGLGIEFEEWRTNSFSLELLRELHLNLLKIRSKTPDYISSYIKIITNGV